MEIKTNFGTIYFEQLESNAWSCKDNKGVAFCEVSNDYLECFIEELKNAQTIKDLSKALESEINSFMFNKTLKGLQSDYHDYNKRSCGATAYTWHESCYVVRKNTLHFGEYKCLADYEYI